MSFRAVHTYMNRIPSFQSLANRSVLWLSQIYMTNFALFLSLALIYTLTDLKCVSHSSLDPSLSFYGFVCNNISPKIAITNKKRNFGQKDNYVKTANFTS